ncbi:MAG: hypothetical protein F4X09_10140 [Gammaproteobacteria bacterium]|nr:hypothetical protein [Gammaproteobacteria bacterium]
MLTQAFEIPVVFHPYGAKLGVRFLPERIEFGIHILPQHPDFGPDFREPGIHILPQRPNVVPQAAEHEIHRPEKNRQHRRRGSHDTGDLDDSIPHDDSPAAPSEGPLFSGRKKHRRQSPLRQVFGEKSPSGVNPASGRIARMQRSRQNQTPSAPGTACAAQQKPQRNTL